MRTSEAFTIAPLLWAWLIPLANPSQRPHCGRHREQTEADGMEEQSGSFLALQFTLTFLNKLDNLSLLKYLLGGSIANAERAWLSLRVFEGSPAVSKVCMNR
jgi:hypothetical protein